MWGKVIHLWKDWNLTNIVPGIWVVITWSLLSDLSRSSSSILNGTSCLPGWPPPTPPPFPALGSPHASPAQCHPLSLEASLSRSASNVNLKTFTLAHLPRWSTGNSCPAPPPPPPQNPLLFYAASMKAHPSSLPRWIVPSVSAWGKPRTILLLFATVGNDDICQMLFILVIRFMPLCRSSLFSLPGCSDDIYE